MNKSIKIICTVSVLFFMNCTNQITFKVSDWYVVKSQGDPIFPDSDFGIKGWHLFCNPGCNTDVMIDNIKSIKWDKRHIIVEQQDNGKTNWYMIIARGEELKCCNRDTTIGALSKTEIDSLIKTENINVKKLKKKVFLK